MKSILVVSNESCEDTVWYFKTKFFLDMLKANLSESAFKKQTKAGAEDRNGTLKCSKACIFFLFSVLAKHNLYAFCLECFFNQYKI